MISGLAKEIADKEAKEVGYCEACREFPATLTIKDSRSDLIYKVCHNCIISLVNVSLTPEQFFNLINAGHSKHEFWLHDDFYDWDSGEALQPR
jgi:hypothetical protein